MPRGFARSRNSANAIALCALLVAGCSDDVHRLGGPGADTTPANPEDRVVGLCRMNADLEIIDDMEDENSALSLIENRFGTWFSFNDMTGTQTPPSYADFFEMEGMTEARGTSWTSARTYGTGFTDWGAGIGFDLYLQLGYDASRYAGVGFYARRAPDTQSRLRMSIPDRDSSPTGHVCGDETFECYAHFGVDVDLTETWEFYEFRWTDLRQPEWTQSVGIPVRSSLFRSEIYGIRFQVDAHQDFDFWIDDLMFLCD